MLTWAMLLATGFALIYWAVFPASFRFERNPQGPQNWWWSFYYSLEMLTTLGLGDIQPDPTWLKLLSAIHTLVGFSLVTASITWMVLVFPALRRVRTLARKSTTLSESEKRTGIPVTTPGMHEILANLAEQVIVARVDLFPLLFYFYAEDRRASLPHALFPLLRFAEDGAGPGHDRLVRLAAEGLGIALQDLADLIGDRLKCKTRAPDLVFREFAALHNP